MVSSGWKNWKPLDSTITTSHIALLHECFLSLGGARAVGAEDWEASRYFYGTTILKTAVPRCLLASCIDGDQEEKGGRSLRTSLVLQIIELRRIDFPFFKLQS